MFEKDLKIGFLMDFYGEVLSERKRTVLDYYYNDDLSLAEIAGEFSISRQGVHDALKNAEKALYEYEQKLGFVKRFSEEREAIAKIDAELESLIRENSQDEALAAKLRTIKEIIDNIE